MEFKLIPSSGTKPSSANINIGGNKYPHTTNYSFTAKYESDISGLWPTAANIPNVKSGSTTYQFYGWSGLASGSTQVSKVLRLTDNYLSTSGTKTFTGSWSTSLSEYNLHYMIESLDPSSGEKQYNSKWYNEDMAYSQVANASGNWSAKQLPGVTAVSTSGINETIGGKTHTFFYYSRNSYELKFFNNSTTAAKTENLKFGSSIAEKDYTPPRPDGVNELWTYKGWYTTPDGLEGSKFNFTGKVMPENNLALYAKWSPPVFQVKFYLIIDDANGPQTIPVDYRSTISDALLDKYLPTGMTNEQFVGWYWFVGDDFLPYDFDTPIDRNDIVLYPIWTTPPLCKVEYESGGAAGTVPVDSGSYTVGASTGVLAPINLVAPDDQVFIGWKELSSNRVYYPNDKILVKDAVMTLTAQWGEKPSSTVLVYNGNGGKSVDDNDTITYLLPLNNETHTVIPGNSFTLEGFIFVAWNTKADGTGTAFAPGAEIVVDNNDEENNMLYAIWEVPPTGPTIEFKNYTGEYTGTPHQPELIDENDLATDDEVFYSTDGGATWTTDKPEYTNAGDYEVAVKVSNPNYEDREETVTVTITPKEVTITVDNASKILGKADPAFTGTVVGVVGEDDLGLSYKRTNDTVNEAGEYPGVISAEITNPNYSLKVEEGDFQILRASLTAKKEALHEDANGDGKPNAGEKIHYTITITNTGDIALTDVKVVDAMLAMDITVKSILPGKSQVLTKDYVLTQNDIDTGLITNTVTVVGKDTDGDPVSSEKAVKVETTLEQESKLSVEKVGTLDDLNDNKIADAGETIIYTITVKNTGNTTLKDIEVIDAMLGLDETIAELLPGANWKHEQAYEIEQEDIDSGRVKNKITVTATDPQGNEIIEEKEIYTPQKQVPGLQVEKTGKYVDVNGDGQANAGDRIDYTINVSNTGNVTLTDIKVVDAKIDLDMTLSTLLPGKSKALTGSYTISQADMDNGSVANSVIVNGKDSKGDPVTTEKTIETTLTQASELFVEKTGKLDDVNDNGQADAGETITYTIIVKNTGNTTLKDIKVKDAMLGLDDTIAELLPGANWKHEQSYVIKLDDIDSGRVKNKITVSATDPKGNEITAEKEIYTPQDQVPGLQVEKTAKYADVNGDGQTNAGDRIDYTITVSNTGNITITNTKVIDELIDLNVTVAILLPGTSSVFTGSYVLTGADLYKGSVKNKVTVEGQDPNGDPVPNEKEITTILAIGLKVTGESAIYDGEKHSLSIEGLVEGDEVYYSTDGGKTWSKDKPEFTNAGDYEVAVKVTNPVYENREGTANVTIEQKEVTVTVANAQKAFGEIDPTFTGTVVGIVGTDDLGLTYQRSNTAEASGTYPGVLTAQITNGNYKLTVIPGDFAITKAKSDQELVVKDYNGEYNGTPHKPDLIDEDDLATDDSVEYSTDGGTTWTTDKPEYTNAGDYEVAVKVSNPNYEDRTGAATIKIGKKAVAITVADKSKVYGTADPELDGTVTGLVAAGDLGEISYSRAKGENVGDYDIDAGYTANSNYEVTVEKGKLTIMPIDTFVVNYDANGGTGSVPSDSNRYKNNETVQVLFTPEPTKAAYIFMGWADNNAADALAQYTVKGSKQLTMGTSDITLYAIWSKCIVTLEASPKTIVGNGVSSTTLTATVTDVDGNPMKGVQVEFGASQYATAENFKDGTTAETDSEGKAVIDYYSSNLESKDSSQATIFELVSFRITATVNDIPKELHAQDWFDITFAPGTLQGVLNEKKVKPDGTEYYAPIAGTEITITLDENGKKWSKTLTTDTDGKYSTYVPWSGETYEISYTRTIITIGSDGEEVKTDLTYTQNGTTDAAKVGEGGTFDSAKTIVGIVLKTEQKEEQTKEKLLNPTELSKYKVEVYSGKTVAVGDKPIADTGLQANGVFNVASTQFTAGGTYQVVVTYSDPAHPELGSVVASVITVTIDKDGVMTLAEALIDPYGNITDINTGAMINDATVTLYYNDGRQVVLPTVPGFAPADNANPQDPTFTKGGFYAFMVYPDKTYYVVATAPGYQTYTSPMLYVGWDVVRHDIKMTPVGGGGSSGGGGGGGGAVITPTSEPIDLAVAIQASSMRVVEGDSVTLTITYKNKSDYDAADVYVTGDVPAAMSFVSAGKGGTLTGSTIRWALGTLKAGQIGTVTFELKAKPMSQAEDFALVTSATGSNAKLNLINLEDDTSFVKLILLSGSGEHKHQRYIKGYPDNTVQPLGNITRAEIAAIFARIMNLQGSVSHTGAYSDVDRDFWAAEYVATASVAGVMKGYPDGSFKPNQPITRAELATVIARYLGIARETNLEQFLDIGNFTDTGGSWAQQTITELFRYAVVSGYADGSFKPDQIITRAEAIKMINRMLYRGPLTNVEASFPDCMTDSWYFGDMEEAIRTHKYTLSPEGYEIMTEYIEETLW